MPIKIRIEKRGAPVDRRKSCFHMGGRGGSTTTLPLVTASHYTIRAEVFLHHARKKCSTGQAVQNFLEKKVEHG